MKKQLLPIVLFLCVFMGLNAQDYISFPTENVHWNVFYVQGETKTHPDSTLLRFAIHGDTVINETSYHKLCLESGDLINPDIEFYGGIREQDKQIFYIGYTYIGPNEETELLLYDFNANINDTVFHVANEYNSIIQDIDSININGIFHKRYKVKSSMVYNFEYDYWIEGIGNVTSSLLGHITPTPICYVYWEHVCFEQNGETVYLNPNFTECYPPDLVSINQVATNLKITIYPNPVENRLNIELPNEIDEMSYQIYDIIGKKVMSGKIKQKATFIPTPIPQGVYMFTANNKDGKCIYMSKFLKQ